VLTIRDEQFAAFRQERLRRLEPVLAARLREADLSALSELDDRTLAQRVREVIARCVAAGLDEEGPVSAAVMLAFDFDLDWMSRRGARAILADRTTSQDARMEAVARWYVRGGWAEPTEGAR
jgi:hypothetical protein